MSGERTIARVLGPVAPAPGPLDAPPQREPGWQRRVWIAVGAVTALVLAGSRLIGLDGSLGHDEVFAVTNYIAPGPEGTYFGRYEPNNHVLFNLAAWASTSILGTAETTYRLWAAVPAIAGTALAMWWAWQRLALVAGVATGLLIAASPLLLELSKQARGYGLVLFAAVCGLVAAERYAATGAVRWLAAFSVAGFIGLGTHAIFVLAYLGQAAALALPRPPRRAVAWSVAAVGAASIIFYAPLLPEILKDADQYYVTEPAAPAAPLATVAPVLAAAARGDDRPGLGPAGFVTAPMHLLAPTTRLIAGGQADECQLECFGTAELVKYGGPPLALVLLGAAVLWLTGRRRLLALLAGPLLMTFVPLTVVGFVLIDRFAAFTLVYLWLLAAVGLWAIGRALARGRVLENTVVVLGVIAAALVLVRAMGVAGRWNALPPEDFKSVGQIVDGTAVNGRSVTPVVTNSSAPDGLRYYVGDRLQVMSPDRLSEYFCSVAEPFVFIDHPLGATEPRYACLADRRTSTIRVLQRTRGHYIDVWIVNAR